MSEAWALRDVTADDASDVLDLVRLCELAEIGEMTFTIEEIRGGLEGDGFRAAGIDHPSGGLAAYAWVRRRDVVGVVLSEIFVRPGSDPAVAGVMLQWLRATAAEIAPGLATHVFVSATNAVVCGLCDAAGGSVIRRNYRMSIALGARAPGPVPPSSGGVLVRNVESEEDLRATHYVVESAFEDHYAHEPESFEEWRRSTVDGAAHDLGLWWLASVDGTPAAALYGFEVTEGGYITTLGTLRDFRGRGLGRALLLTAFAEFARRGAAKVSLNVDATNPTGAVALYQSVGMAIQHEGLRYELPAG